MKVFQVLVCAVAVSGLLAGASADETKQKKGKQQKAPSVSQRLLDGIELTADQKEKVAAIDKEFAPALMEINKKRSAILTPEQQKAQREATKAAKDAGKSAAETRKAVQEAGNLSADQKEKMAVLQKSQQELNGKVIAALKKVLTPEQQEKLPKTGGAKKGDGAKGKGKGKKKAE